MPAYTKAVSGQRSARRTSERRKRRWRTARRLTPDILVAEEQIDRIFHRGAERRAEYLIAGLVLLAHPVEY